MKRWLTILLVAVFGFWLLRHAHCGGGHGPGSRWERLAARCESERSLHEARLALKRAGDEIRLSLREARDDLRESLHELKDDLHEAFGPHGAEPDRREPAEGLPVPIVPAGTRTAEDCVQAAARQEGEADFDASVRSVPGLLSATPERAQAEARAALQRFVSEWIKPDAPGDWNPPARLIDELVVESTTRPIAKEYGVVYLTELKIDPAPRHRQALVAAYHRELVNHRLVTIGGGLGFILICLAAVSSYIRADEATRGYYTRPLRFAAAAAVGAAGVLLYQLVV